ncbi:MAG: hypothetical protein JWM08_1719 [Candidatus Angelobacter sp.]|nr:hypothetical protein [Candidatus Angelobacter sp.]
MVEYVVRMQLGICLCGQPAWRSHDTQPRYSQAWVVLGQHEVGSSIPELPGSPKVQILNHSHRGLYKPIFLKTLHYFIRLIRIGFTQP